MEKTILNRICKWFENYAKTFYTDDNEINTNISLKENHTYRVCDITRKATNYMGLDKNKKNTAVAISLLHDIGRFEQFAKFKTFKDPISIDHAELGIEIIEKNKLLEGIDSIQQKIILKSVEYHNKIKIPENIDDDIKKYAMLLRDMDKLDIYNVVIDVYRNHSNSEVAVEKDLDRSEKLNKDILNAFLNQESISYESIKNINDAKLLRLSWIYDFNYEYSIKYLKESKYLNNILDTMPEFDEIEKIRKTIDDYLNTSKVRMEF